MRQSTFARRVIAALLAAGWKVNNKGLKKSVKAVMEELQSRDEFRLFVKRDTQHGWVWFVWQGPDAEYKDGNEIVADYTINLDDVIEPLSEAADRRPS